MRCRIFTAAVITPWKQFESHTAFSIGILSDKIRMVVFNLIVTVAVIRNEILLEVIFMWQCSDDDTKANLCSKDGKAEAITGVHGLGFFFSQFYTSKSGRKLSLHAGLVLWIALAVTRRICLCCSPLAHNQVFARKAECFNVEKIVVKKL